MSIEFPAKTLPIELDHGIFLDPIKARTLGESLHSAYRTAAAYPHIVIDDFLPVEMAEEILANFPRQQMEGDKFYSGGYTGSNKRQVAPNDCNEYMRHVFNFLNSAPVLQFLEGLTGIEALTSDPYFNGGGFHEILPGGRLGIHADFRIHEQLHLNRRINMLIYLNKDWKESYGGNLEVWNTQMTEAVSSVPPLFNRCVIFNTDADSYHGHPEPLNTPDGVTRKSIALYYYTASKKVYDDTPAHTTMYAARPGESKAIRQQVSKFNRRNYLKDWLPPVILRAVKKLGTKRSE